jgi:prepilin-type N-terminal cleavage/methylation domain-containing protein/prepilin-type processing-associated H-X9-DG protein
MRSHSKRAFTLMELLVVISIIAILAALVLGNMQKIREYGFRTGCLSNMRQVGMGLRYYANDNDGELPGRAEGDVDKWPKALYAYLNDWRVYVDPGDAKARTLKQEDLLNNTGGNKTSFFFNGFNDVGAYTDSSIRVRLQQISSPASTIMLGQKKYGTYHFYMDLAEPPHGNQNDVLNKEAYSGGSNYVFADGSARYLKKADYSDQLWMVNKDYSIPEFAP